MMHKHIKGKKLLLLGGASQHIKVVDAAQEMGVYVICVDPIIDAPVKKKADETYLRDVRDIEFLFNLCQKKNVDGALNVCLDPCQIPYQKICQSLNYPCFGDEEQFSILTDKKRFKKFCIENGIDVVPELNIDLSDRNHSQIEFPILVKPVDSRGSRGQSICYSFEELKAAVPKAMKESRAGDVLFEKYMGRINDFMVSYLVVDGEPHLTRTADRYLGEPDLGLQNVSTANISPSRYTDLYIDNIDPNVKQMIKKIGIKNGPVFMQGFFDHNTVRFYDPGLRFPGSEYEISYKVINEIDLMKMLVEFALTGAISGNFNDFKEHSYLNGYFVVSLYPPVRAGVINKIIGLEKIKQISNVVAFSQRYRQGDEVQQFNNVRQRFCAVEIVAPSLDKLIKTIKIVQRSIKVLDQDGNDLLYGALETSRIKPYGFK